MYTLCVKNMANNALYKLLGLRVEKKLLHKCKGHNRNFKYYMELGNKYVFLLGQNNNFYELTLWEEEIECCSGWTVANLGCHKLSKVGKFGGKTHNLINNLENDVDLSGLYKKSDLEVKTPFFKFSNIGGDEYYPAGYVKIIFEKFVPIPQARIKDKRMVWIFKGESNVGKTYLSAKLHDMESYETDQSNTLPKDMKQNVIVVGNKYDFSIEDIKQNIYDVDNCEIILVEFHKYQNANTVYI